MVDMMEEDTCVAVVPVFRGLSRAEQFQVAEIAEPTSLAKGDVLYIAGAQVSQLMVVHRGRVKVTRTTADGHEQLVRVLGTGDFLGESAFLTGERPDHSVVALEPTQMCVFSHAQLGNLVRKHPSIALRMLQTLSQRLSETERRLTSAFSSPVGTRVADYLLSLPSTTTGSHPVVTLPLAKKDIASLLDTTPESISRQLRHFQDSGVIDQRECGRIELLDVDTLVDLAGEL